MHAATAEVADALTHLIRGIHCAGHAVARYSSSTWDKSMFAMLNRLVEGGPQRLSDLAEAVHLDLSTVSRQVTHLVAEGLVQRRPDPADGRASQLMVTPAGEQLLAEKDRERRAWVAQMLADWSPAEQAEFAAYLRRFNSAYETYLPKLIKELSQRHSAAAADSGGPPSNADASDADVGAGRGSRTPGRTDSYEGATT